MDVRRKIFSLALLAMHFAVQPAEIDQPIGEDLDDEMVLEGEGKNKEAMEQIEKDANVLLEDFSKKIEKEIKKQPAAVIEKEFKQICEKDLLGMLKAAFHLFMGSGTSRIEEKLSKLSLDEKIKVLVWFQINEIIHKVGSLNFYFQEKQQQEAAKKAQQQESVVRHNVKILPYAEALKFFSLLGKKAESDVLYACEYMVAFNEQFIKDVLKAQAGGKEKEFLENKINPGVSKFVADTISRINDAKQKGVGIIVGGDFDAFTAAWEKDDELTCESLLDNAIKLADALRNNQLNPQVRKKLKGNFDVITKTLQTWYTEEEVAKRRQAKNALLKPNQNILKEDTVVILTEKLPKSAAIKVYCEQLRGRPDNVKKQPTA